MKLYIQKPTVKGAWLWINEGYKAAWKEHGYDVIPYADILEINTADKYHLMAWEYDIKGRNEAIEVLEKAQKVYLYVQPNYFPPPWGLHPNWQCSLGDDTISQINNMEHVHLWNFGDTRSDFSLNGTRCFRSHWDLIQSTINQLKIQNMLLIYVL